MMGIYHLLSLVKNILNNKMYTILNYNDIFKNIKKQEDKFNPHCLIQRISGLEDKNT